MFVKMLCANLEGANLAGSNFEDPAGVYILALGSFVVGTYCGTEALCGRDHLWSGPFVVPGPFE